MSYTPPTSGGGASANAIVYDPAAPNGYGQAYRNNQIHLHYWPGLVGGQGVTDAQRATNLTAINAAITAAISANKKLIAGGDTYEVMGGPIVIPVNAGFKSDFGNSHFFQMSNNVPVMTVGSQQGPTYSYGTEVKNVNLHYGVDVTGQQNTCYIKIGDQDASVFENIGCGQNFGNVVPWRGMWLSNGSISGNMFQCRFQDVFISGAQYCLFDVNITGTQNMYKNFYINNGGGTSNPISGPAVNWDGGNAEQMSSTVEQMNVEWVATNTAMHFNNFKGMHFSGLHFEGVLMTGNNPAIFRNVVSEIYIETCELMTLKTNGTGGLAATGVPRLFDGYAAEIFKVDNLKFEATNAGDISVDMLIIGNEGYGGPMIDIQNLTLQDPPGNNFQHLSWSATVPRSLAPPARLNRLSFGFAGYELFQPQIDLSQDRQNFGWMHRAEYTAPATLGATRTLTLSKYLNQSGRIIATTSAAGGQPVINVPSTAGVSLGAFVTGSNVPAGAKVASFVTNTSVTLDKNLTGAITNGGVTIRLQRAPDTVSVLRTCEAGDNNVLNIVDDDGNLIYAITNSCASQSFYLPPGGNWTAINGINP